MVWYVRSQASACTAVVNAMQHLQTGGEHLLA